MVFNDLKTAIQKHFNNITTSGHLFQTSVGKDELWETYLNSFPEGTNPMFKERTEHDCQCCKQFIRQCGNVVTIVDNEPVSIWDINVGGHYQVVADALSKLVKSKPVIDLFLSPETHLGTDFSTQLDEDDEVIKWEHFHFKLPKRFVKRADTIGGILGETRTSAEVFKRALVEITLDSVNTVLELIEQKSIYRGEEHKKAVESFLNLKTQYDLVTDDKKDNYCWSVIPLIGAISRIKNTAIGTLLVDISQGTVLDDAVNLFESKVAPQNYKRPTALVTKAMIKNAEKTVSELGIENSLPRRFAVDEDITINNVMYANKAIKKALSVFDEMAKEVSEKVKNLDKVETVDIETFVETILPKAEKVEFLLENRHTNNLMSLIAPQDETAKNIFKWKNNYSWGYNGEIADSMKQRVKKAGGKVDGVLRFSIQWNDGDKNPNDYDAHCTEPCGNKIYFSSYRNGKTTGVLDVDIVNPEKDIAVENITWSDIDKMGEGEYHFQVHNYFHRGGKSGFKAEIEYDGKIHSYEYAKDLKQSKKVTVAKVSFFRKEGFKIVESMPSTVASKQVWGIATNNYHKVKMIMKSPNHWDGNETGNKHYFFILDDCKNPERARGFYNEFLNEGLKDHRKVFEILGSKLKTEKSDRQLSGLGFSSTQKNDVICKVTGSFARTIKINF